ncbi:hypothetical protein M3P05_02590 [Sansalvadorimonas sp. 2012CJ34-2]|uniref:Uncharacterized protein n=1 Tax=Parendozoicomonas callyspongiae TaxID=2942213 RepID=A0ABT0PC21_9GAMM|nr:hypothetical protein [Sansalvadorimonas sp. 2012CJ34-2]MCL6268838.1 hypothetical protein [Sansalvadorimonas sp. 2012CJ34-2]
MTLNNNGIDKTIKLCQLSQLAIDLAENAQAHQEFINCLLEHQCYRDCIDFMAHALEKDKAICWGFECQQSVAANHNPKEARLMDLISEWLNSPTDENRRMHESSLDTIGVGSPVAWLSMAIFWSGGSLTPVGSAVVEAQPFMTGHAVSGSQLLTIYDQDAKYQDKRFHLFIEKGAQLISHSKRHNATNDQPQDRGWGSLD